MQDARWRSAIQLLGSIRAARILCKSVVEFSEHPAPDLLTCILRRHSFLMRQLLALSDAFPRSLMWHSGHPTAVRHGTGSMSTQSADPADKFDHPALLLLASWTGS